MNRSVGKGQHDTGVASTRDRRVFFTPDRSCQALPGSFAPVPGTGRAAQRGPDCATLARKGRCLTPLTDKPAFSTGARHSTALCLALMRDEASTNA